MAYKAWMNISQLCIQNCFRACGFVKDVIYNVSDEPIVNINNEFQGIPFNSEKVVTFEEYVNVDNDVGVTGNLGDDDILGQVSVENEESDDDDVGNREEVVLSLIHI